MKTEIANRLAIPKHGTCCSKNCDKKKFCIHSSLNNKEVIKCSTTKFTKKLIFPVNNENSPLEVNLSKPPKITNLKSDLVLKRNLFGEKLKQKVLKYDTNKEGLNTYRERSRFYNDGSTTNLLNKINEKDEDTKVEEDSNTFNIITHSDHKKSNSFTPTDTLPYIITNNTNYYFSNYITNKPKHIIDITSFDFEYSNLDELTYLLNNISLRQNSYCNRFKQSLKDLDTYGKDISKYMHTDQQLHRLTKMTKTYQTDYNKINEKMRVKMIDWMIEVTNNYKCDENTFFLAVELLDSYLTNNYLRIIIPSELHLIGCSCIFIASKLNDIKPIKLKIIEERISHGKLTKDEIKEEEQRILITLRYNVIFPTVYDYGIRYLFDMFRICIEQCDLIKCLCSENSEHSMRYYKQFKSILFYFLKISNFDYKIMQNLPSLIAAGCINVTNKIVEAMDKNDDTPDISNKKSNFQSRLSKIADVTTYELSIISREILYISQNLNTLFGDCDNIKQFVASINHLVN